MAVYNRAILGASENVNLNANAFDLMAEAYQIDQSLFEAVIEVDFAEAFNEAGIISLNEEEQAAAKAAQKEGILKKAWEVLQKIGKAIEQIFDSIVSFISNLIANDAKIKEKYGKYFTSVNNFKGCDVKGKYVDFGYVEGMRQVFKRKFNAAGEASGVEDAGEAGNVDLNRIVVDSGEKSIIDVMGSLDFTKMVEYVQGGYKTVLEEVKKSKNEAIAACKKYEDELKKAKNEKADGANEAYKKAIKATTGIKASASKYKSMIVSATAHARACYLKLGKWAIANNGGTAEANNAGERPDRSNVNDVRPGAYKRDSENVLKNRPQPDAKTRKTLNNEAVDMLIELESNLFIEHMANLV